MDYMIQESYSLFSSGLSANYSKVNINNQIKVQVTLISGAYTLIIHSSYLFNVTISQPLEAADPAPFVIIRSA